MDTNSTSETIRLKSILESTDLKETIEDILYNEPCDMGDEIKYRKEVIDFYSTLREFYEIIEDIEDM